jgi:hypothetical protein
MTTTENKKKEKAPENNEPVSFVQDVDMLILNGFRVVRVPLNPQLSPRRPTSASPVLQGRAWP